MGKPQECLSGAQQVGASGATSPAMLLSQKKALGRHNQFPYPRFQADCLLELGNPIQLTIGPGIDLGIGKVGKIRPIQGS